MVRTRTIREAAAYFQESDPQTCLTETAIRTLLRTGAVPSARVGKKYLVTIEGPWKPIRRALWGRRSPNPRRIRKTCPGSGRSSEAFTFPGVEK